MFLRVIIITVFARVSCNIVRFDPILDVSFKEESPSELDIVANSDNNDNLVNNVTSEYVGPGFVFQVRKRSFS